MLPTAERPKNRGHNDLRHLPIPLASTVIAIWTSIFKRPPQLPMDTRSTTHNLTTITTTITTGIPIPITSRRQHMSHRRRIVKGILNPNHLTRLPDPTRNIRCLLMTPSIRSNRQERRLSLTSSPTAASPLANMGIITTVSRHLRHLTTTTTCQWIVTRVVREVMGCESLVAVGVEATTPMEMVTVAHKRRIWRDVVLLMILVLVAQLGTPTQMGMENPVTVMILGRIATAIA